MKNVMMALCTCFVVCAVANASLTALYELDGNPNDSSINGYDGVIFPFGVPTPTWDPASADPTLNGSLTFPGSTGYSVDCGDVPVSAVSATIAYWIKADVLGNYEPLARFPNNATGQGFVVKLRSGGGVRFRVGSKSSYSDVRIDKAASDVYYAAGQWAHHAFVYTKIGGTITVDFYVNGEFVVRKTLTTTKGVSAATGTHLYIGASVDTGTGEAFKGSMDDVRIYGHALSEAEIKALPGLGGGGPDVDPYAQVYSSGIFYPFYCRTLDSRQDYIVKPENLELSKYGGWKAHRVAATGFFRVEKIDGRWWAIDPEGYLYVHLAPSSVNLNNYTADQIYQLLLQYGFNGLGCWSDETILQSSLKNQTPLAYCPKISFIGVYRRQRDPRIEMPVFDDEFETYANQLAQGFSSYKNDPHVFGYLSDNEMPWRDEGLPAHLAITNPTDKNYITAIDFLTARGKTAGNWDTEDQYAYMALMAERYYSVVSAAIKNVDSNHMYIGSRCHSTEKQIEDFMRNAGKYVDVFSMNHYHKWSSRQVEIQNMSEWSGRPLMITEFYAMQDMPIVEKGAGWLVLDQASRGSFYQNFVSTLAETGYVVGWHWFKFQDDRNGNKGIVDESGNLYTELLNEMQQMNSQLYDFIDYADSRPDPNVSLFPEADAYFQGSVNYGADPELWVKKTSFSYHRESYLRFDLSTLKNNIASAKLHLYSLDTGSETGFFQAQLVSNNTWGEMTININNHPAGSTVLGSWSDGGGDIVIDVTDALLDALGTGKKLSIRIVSMVENGSIPKYGSWENANPVARPQLRIH